MVAVLSFFGVWEFIRFSFFIFPSTESSAFWFLQCRTVHSGKSFIFLNPLFIGLSPSFGGSALWC